MKYAIRVEETKGKTFIVESDSLEEAINKVERGVINLDEEPGEGEIGVFASPFAMENGIATPEQIEYCEVFK